jgi:hypothetical protein
MGRKTASRKKRSAGDKAGSDDGDAPLNSVELINRLADLLLSTNTCESSQEARGTSEAIVEDVVGLGDERTPEDVAGPLATLLADYFDELTAEKAEEMARSVLGAAAMKEDDQSSDDDSNNSTDDEGPGSDIDVEDGDDGEYIGEGECELCEREIKLTRHHLIPKTTWSKMKKKIPAAVEALASGQEDKARMILGGNLIDDLPPEIVEDPSNTILIRRFLSKTCKICRPCHSTVHKLHTETELAESYSTIDKLLEDEELLKFCKWASKQKCGKYSLNHR